MEKITLREAVIVEGKYDKIRLESLVDALILTTDGFRIFTDKDMCALIRRLASTCGIVVVTDSDAAGFKIRAHIANIAKDGEVAHVYVPDILGKERRKDKPGAEGKLGVEGMDTRSLEAAFRAAGIIGDGVKETSRISKQDLYDAGFSGRENSRGLREMLTQRLDLPRRLSANSLPAVLSHLITREELYKLAEEFSQ